MPRSELRNRIEVVRAALRSLHRDRSYLAGPAYDDGGHPMETSPARLVDRVDEPPTHLPHARLLASDEDQ
jgi:hypothetical protein